MKCCICGNEIVGIGNNPWPCYDKNKKCCDNCNILFVIPKRIEYVLKGKKYEI